MTTLPCTVCEAPVPVWEYTPHLKACVKIKVGLAPKPPISQLDATILAAYTHRIHEDDQAQAHLRESTRTNEKPNEITGLKELIDQSKQPGAAQGGWTSWNDRAGKPRAADVPSGRVQCASCNGLTVMYPNCHACSGKGWV
jgi:hypothetical protein